MSEENSVAFPELDLAKIAANEQIPHDVRNDKLQEVFKPTVRKDKLQEFFNNLGNCGDQRRARFVACFTVGMGNAGIEVD